jgi:hypothetical protein
VGGREPFKLRRALGALLGTEPARGAEPGALDLLYAACISSGLGEDECDRIYWRSYWRSGEELREAAGEVLDRFELRGRCLVEKGVGVEDPSVCEGSLDGGLLIVGSRMQFFVDGEMRNAVARVGDLCAVAIGSGRLGDRALRELKAGRTGLLEHDGATALISVRGCRLGDMPRLAERAAEMPYREIFKSCEPFGDEEAEGEALSKAERLELERCLELLGMLEMGGGS